MASSPRRRRRRRSDRRSGPSSWLSHREFEAGPPGPALGVWGATTSSAHRRRKGRWRPGRPTWSWDAPSRARKTRGPPRSRWLLRRNHEVSAPVLRPAGLLLLVAERLLLAHADHVDPVGGDPEVHQVVVHGIRAALAECEVVLARAPRVGMPLDRHPD